MIPSHCYCLFGIITIYFSLLTHSLSSPTLHFCRHDQRDALLEFIDEFRYGNTSILSWKKSSDCCHWKGVTCDEKHGQVISLELSGTSLKGSFNANSSLFRLQYLRHLDLMNCDLIGDIPSSIGNLSRLTFIDLSMNGLVGEIPASVGNLNQLRDLILENNRLTGMIPSSIGNLTYLLHLRLSGNHLVGEVPNSIGNLNELKVLSLENNNFSGNLPISFANLTKLSNIVLYYNNFTSRLPSDMSGLFHNLKSIDIAFNSFFGPFPKSLFSFPSLEYFHLEENQFEGPIEFANTSSPKLEFLNLSLNKFDGPIPESISEFLNLKSLDLSNNNITGSIPRSISKLVHLTDLDLSYNKLKGEVPSFLWRFTTLLLSHNSFSSFENLSQETPIQFLDLSSNSFSGPFPHWICKLKRLHLLFLANNLFNGSVPPCLRNSVGDLRQLVLRNNSFSGVIPDIFDNATKLQSLDVSHNQLEGKFPKSLINCKALQLVNVESNKLKDKFPSWLLGSLPSLHVLILRSNEFYGPLYHHRHMSIGFQSLRIIDISHNDFTGNLPPHYFSNWREMNTLTKEKDEYMEDDDIYVVYFHTMEIVNKGVVTRFDHIRKDFRAIDFSGNRIYGKIPDSIGILKELRLLNLSGNAFTSDIPLSLANLINLEALDLSCNKLSGQIPQDLGDLSFLSYMNFSHNLLRGPVPRSTQFQRQKCSSFLGNPGLYGLKDICEGSHVPNATSKQPEEASESEEQMFNWVAAAIAYGPGLFCGLVMGHIFTSHNQEWFAEMFGRRKLRVTAFAR